MCIRDRYVGPPMSPMYPAKSASPPDMALSTTRAWNDYQSSDQFLSLNTGAKDTTPPFDSKKPLETYGSRILNTFWGSLRRDTLLWGDRYDLVLTRIARISSHFVTVALLLFLTYNFHHNSHIVCPHDCLEIGNLVDALIDRVIGFSEQDARFIVICLVLTCPVTVIITLLIKYSEFWGTQQPKDRYQSFKQRETKERKLGYIIAIVLILLSTIYINYKTYDDACVNQRREVSDWLFTFIICYFVEITLFDPFKQMLKQLIVVIVFRLESLLKKKNKISPL
eukprot:TRINITY_DN10874_c0_g1_i4.p1 TRINITY_DN10874_c0_g1~~TRINITY_DN10874_c0_g1_i4.p1  ORF type:complete len:311 (-),score=55.25 TRINITY_DN10874_c0_g1_i4:270-1112(-)